MKISAPIAFIKIFISPQYRYGEYGTVHIVVPKKKIFLLEEGKSGLYIVSEENMRPPVLKQLLQWMYLKEITVQLADIPVSSVPDPCHCGVDPDPRIHASD